METRKHVLLAAVLVFAACDGTDPDEERFFADLSGANERPNAANTPATGRADFTVDEDGTVSYTLEVNGLRNVVAAHIHGPATTESNAGVVVTLFTSSPALAGPTTGRLTSGNFRSTDTNAQGQSAVGMDSLLALMRGGQAYVNVHTNDGVAPGGTGPGDFPGGEIRGHIQRR